MIRIISSLANSYNILSSKKNLLIILVLGVILRLFWITFIQTTPVSDSSVYLSLAMSIASGTGYAYSNGEVTAYWPVGYPAFLGFILWITHGSLWAGKFANIVLYFFTSVVFYKIARLYQKASIGLVVISYLSFAPNQIAYSNLYASEPLALFFISLIAFFLIKIIKGEGSLYLFMAAFSTAFGAFVKPQLIIYPVAILFIFSVVLWQPLYLKKLGIIYLVSVLLIMPWTLRNYYYFDALVPISNNGGINFYIGNNPHANGRYNSNQSIRAPLENLSEIEKDKTAKSLALNYIRENPYSALGLLPSKFLNLYKTDAEGISWNIQGIKDASKKENLLLYILQWVSQIIYMILMISAAPCLFFAFSRSQRNERINLIVPLAFAIIGTSIYMVFFGASRFHYIILPFLFFYIDYVLGVKPKS